MLAFLVGVDWGIGQLTGTDEATIKKTAGSRNGAAVLVLGDIDTSATALAAPHKKTFLRFGDLVTAETSQSGFDGATITEQMYKQLRGWNYKRIIVVGIGAGAQLGTDLVDYDRVNGRHFQFSFVLVDAQTGPADTTHEMTSQFFSYWYAGKLSDLVHGFAGKGQPYSSWTDQLRYQRNHLGYRPDAYRGTPMVFLQSDKDGDVKKEAAASWQRIFGGGQILHVPNSGHAGLITAAKPWDNALNKALSVVG